MAALDQVPQKEDLLHYSIEREDIMYPWMPVYMGNNN
jgi:hypothetical protein